MNIIVQVLVGGLTGWLTGKAVEVEGRLKVVREGHVFDIIYGIIGAMIGEYLFFWMVMGKGDTFSSFATTVLGSITLVGAARLIAARWRLARSYKNRA
ncbi:MAG TPA: GlsB/YeaQ/YmgE family stress response membrane protein [Candidatus Udaeobacter sp.]|nr:GlsB/YeaQ/YmgE family stress response membrane protein [Candidatus Udaeobacter sp.]